jgi:hypothetical protein
MNKEEVRRIMKSKTALQMQEWVMTLDDLTAIEVSRHVVEITREHDIERDTPEGIAEYNKAMKSINDVEDRVLGQQVTSLMKEVELDAAFKKADKAFAGMINALLNEIEKKPSNVEKLKEMARELRQIEIDSGFYEPAKWERLKD